MCSILIILNQCFACKKPFFFLSSRLHHCLIMQCRAQTVVVSFTKVNLGRLIWDVSVSKLEKVPR